MKKTALLLAALLLLLCACSSRDSEAEAQRAAAREQLAAARENPETAQEPEDQEIPEAQEEEPQGFAPVVLAGDENCSAVLRAYEPESDLGPMLRLVLENKTEKTLMFSIGDMSVNGVRCDPCWACEVEPESTAVSDVWWGQDELRRCGIRYLKDLAFDFEVYDSENWEDGDLVDAALEVTLPGGEGEAVEEVFYEDFDEQVLAEGEGFRVTAKQFERDGDFEAALTLYLVNETDRTLLFIADEVTADGADCDVFWADVLRPGVTAYSDVRWFADHLEGLGDFETVTFRLDVCDNGDWSADALYSGNVTVKLQ